MAARKAPPLPLVLDSSCWLEFFGDSARADLFAPAIERVEMLIVPVITVYEVVKVVNRDFGSAVARRALGMMQKGQIVDLTLPLCLDAVLNGLPLADSLILATARAHGAQLWTQAAHFEHLENVRFFPKT